MSDVDHALAVDVLAQVRTLTRLLTEADRLEDGVDRALALTATFCGWEYAECRVFTASRDQARRIGSYLGDRPELAAAKLALPDVVTPGDERFARMCTPDLQECLPGAFGDAFAGIADASRLARGMVIPAPVFGAPIATVIALWSHDHPVSAQAKAFAEVLAAQIGLAVRRDHVLSAVVRQQEASDRSNVDLDAFAAIASHDLQEPLRKIRTFGDRLRIRHGEELGPEASSLVQRTIDTAARMQRLIEDILAYSRLEHRASSHEIVDLTMLVQHVVDELAEQLTATEGRITVDDLPQAMVDIGMMRQLFTNLLSNSIKFRRPGVAPVIHVSGTLAPDGGARITVRDNGIGFEPHHAERIFGLLQRLHGRAAYDGSGVGLAICRRVAQRHGGSITAHGLLDEGAEFTILLPPTRPEREIEST
jgi:signal transduction histidine kinase